MSGGVRRTEDFHTIKTRGLTIQAFNGTFAPAGAVIAATDNSGHYSPVVDLSLNSVTAGSGNFNQIVLAGPSSTTGTLTYTANGLAINGVALPDFTQQPFFLLDPATAPLSSVITGYNRLLTTLSLQRAFVTLQVPDINLVFQTGCAITWATFPTGFPTAYTNFSISIPAGTAIKAFTLVNQLNEASLNAAMPLNFYLSTTSTISVFVATSYSMFYTDVSVFGESQRFVDHIGLAVLAPSYASRGILNAYTGNLIGAPLTSGYGSSPPAPTGTPIPYSPSLQNTYVEIQINLSQLTGNDVAIGVYLDGVSIDSIGIAASYFVFGLQPGTTYSIALTFSTSFDEGPLSTPLSVTTTATPTTAYDMLASAATTVTPYGGIPLNDTFITVSDTSNSVWSLFPSPLTSVSQINSVTFKYYSGYSASFTYNGDARFGYVRDVSPLGNENGLCNAGANRVIPPQFGDLYAIGSPPQLTPGPSTHANTSYSITDYMMLRRMFSTTGYDNNVDATRGLQFYWYCGYGGTYIQNSQINEFVINYL
jgi:hypothetical protein